MMDVEKLLEDAKKVEKDDINSFVLWKLGDRKKEKVKELIDESDEIKEMVEKILSFSGTERLGCVETDYETLPIFRVPDEFQKFKDMMIKDDKLPYVRFSFYFADEHDEIVSDIVLDTRGENYLSEYLDDGLTYDEKKKFVKYRNEITTKYFDDGLPDSWKSESNFYELDDIEYGQYVYVSWDSNKFGDIE